MFLNNSNCNFINVNLKSLLEIKVKKNVKTNLFFLNKNLSIRSITKSTTGVLKKLLFFRNVHGREQVIRTRSTCTNASKDASCLPKTAHDSFDNFDKLKSNVNSNSTQGTVSLDELGQEAKQIVDKFHDYFKDVEISGSSMLNNKELTNKLYFWYLKHQKVQNTEPLDYSSFREDLKNGDSDIQELLDEVNALKKNLTINTKPVLEKSPSNFNYTEGFLSKQDLGPVEEGYLLVEFKNVFVDPRSPEFLSSLEPPIRDIVWEFTSKQPVVLSPSSSKYLGNGNSSHAEIYTSKKENVETVLTNYEKSLLIIERENGSAYLNAQLTLVDSLKHLGLEPSLFAEGLIRKNLNEIQKIEVTKSVSDDYSSYSRDLGLLSGKGNVEFDGIRGEAGRKNSHIAAYLNGAKTRFHEDQNIRHYPTSNESYQDGYSVVTDGPNKGDVLINESKIKVNPPISVYCPKFGVTLTFPKTIVHEHGYAIYEDNLIKDNGIKKQSVTVKNFSTQEYEHIYTPIKLKRWITSVTEQVSKNDLKQVGQEQGVKNVSINVKGDVTCDPTMQSVFTKEGVRLAERAMKDIVVGRSVLNKEGSNIRFQVTNPKDPTGAPIAIDVSRNEGFVKSVSDSTLAVGIQTAKKKQGPWDYKFRDLPDGSE